MKAVFTEHISLKIIRANTFIIFKDQALEKKVTLFSLTSYRLRYHVSKLNAFHPTGRFQQSLTFCNIRDY